LSQRLGAQVTIASETFQLTGSFKFRGAYNVALNVPNWPIIRDHAAGIIEVLEENIREGLRLLYSLANLKVEPTGALTIGAVLTSPEKVQGHEICCIVSGGNVDTALYRDCLS
jgi:threonine dehydratase